MMINVTWPQIKEFVDERDLSIQWIIKEEAYILSAIDGPIELLATIKYVSPTPADSDQEDFEVNYLPSGNASFTPAAAAVLTQLAAINSNTNDASTESTLQDILTAIEDMSTTNLSNTLTNGHILVGNGANVAQDVAVTGDVTITNAGVTAVGATKITNAMLAGSIALTKLLNLGSGYAIPYVFTPSGVGSTQTDATGSLVDITGMSFPIAASESWVFFCWMEHGCNNTGGLDYGINGPSGMTMRVTAQGASTGITAQTSAILTTLNTAAGVSFNTANSQGGRAMLSGKVLASATPGNVTVKFCAHTATQTATIYSESFGIAFRVA